MTFWGLNASQEISLKHAAVTSIDDFFKEEKSFDEVIDTRSPAEFAEDHMPGAQNYPVLSNEERIQVGTLYKQKSAFEAKKVGAVLVGRHISDYLESSFNQHDLTWRPMVYCWRGGTRSGAMTHVLREVGWKATQLEGGYKAYRRFVIDQLETLPRRFEFRVVCGETGSAKSRLLEALAQQGAQVIDLEALACHKGSVLGSLPEQPQPSQKMFESLVWDNLRNLDPSRPVFIEAESKKIGKLRTPEILFECMTKAERMVRIDVSAQARVDFLLNDYDYFLKDPQLLKSKLSYLKSLHGAKVIQRWADMIDQAQWQDLVWQLLTEHYDPAYRKSMKATYTALEEAEVLSADLLDQKTFERWALELAGVTNLE